MSTKEQSVGEFCVNLDRQTRRLFRMNVEKFKALKNLGLALIIAYIGLEAQMNPYHVIGVILAVASPDALELVLGNGIGFDVSEGKDE